MVELSITPYLASYHLDGIHTDAAPPSTKKYKLLKFGNCIQFKVNEHPTLISFEDFLRKRNPLRQIRCEGQCYVRYCHDDECLTLSN